MEWRSACDQGPHITLGNQVFYAYLWYLGDITPTRWGKRYDRRRLLFAKKKESAAVHKTSSRTCAGRGGLLRGTLGRGCQAGAMLTWRPECAMRGRYTILHSLSTLRLLVILVLTTPHSLVWRRLDRGFPAHFGIPSDYLLSSPQQCFSACRERRTEGY